VTPSSPVDGDPAAIDVLAVLAENAELERAVTESELASEQRERVEQFVKQAAAAGAAAWNPPERAELRRAISHWVALLNRDGATGAKPQLARYSGRPPKLEDIDGADALERARAGEPIVACRIERQDLRELSGLDDVRIVDCVVIGCDLRGVELARARLLHTTFADCNLSHAALPTLVATSSIFKGGSLEGAQAPGATFCGTLFDGVALRGGGFDRASFASATLRNVDAWQARLSGTLFDLTTLESVGFEEAQLDHTIFTGATLRSLRFAGGDLADSIFSGADVRGSSFAGARLQRALFRTAIGVRFAIFDPGAAGQADFSADDAALLSEGVSVQTA